MKPKVLLFDIETMANKAFVWGKYEQDVIAYIQEGYMLSWSAKWLGGKTITRGLRDYKGYKPYSPDDSKLVKELHDLFNEADILIAHNGDKFDIKKSNTAFIKNGLLPPEPYKTVDTLKIARRYFAFNSNKLDDLGQFLGCGRKIKHPGFDMWLGCEAGEEKDWDLMLKYNRQDVLLLERVYKKLLPWIENHPTFKDGILDCPNCHKQNFHKKGQDFFRGVKSQRNKCNECGTNFYSKL